MKRHCHHDCLSLNLQRLFWRCVLLSVFVSWVGSQAQAATFTVSNTNDSGAGSLRAAMTSAMATPAADEIVFTANGTITLASPLPDLLSAGGNLTITGNGPANTIIDGAGAYRPFYSGWQNNLAFTLRRLTVRNGRADQLQGGVIYFFGGSNASLTIAEVEFIGNTATWDGGAIFTSAPLNISNSLFQDNVSGTFGAAFYEDGSAVTVTNSTFTGNQSTQTLISFVGSPQAHLVNVTITGNSYGKGIESYGGASVRLVNTLIAGNSGSGDDLLAFGGGSFNLADSHNNVIGYVGNSGFTAANDNQIGVTEPLIGALGAYGGSTRTMPILPYSPALNTGTNIGGIPATDQRGLARVGAVDVGAFESRGFAISAHSGNGQSAPVSTAFAQPLVARVTANSVVEPVQGGRVIFTAPPSGASVGLGSTSATIDSNGDAQTTATANTTAGGPYVVAADSPTTGNTQFLLINTLAGNPACAGYVFPYTLTGANNIARVAELRQAIECGNASGSAFSIDLAGHVLVFSDGPYSDADGANALPIITGTATLTHGTLERDAAAVPFRFLKAGAGAPLHLGNMRFVNGHSTMDGGAVLADYVFQAGMTRFENNRANGHGGGLRLRDPSSSSMLIGDDFLGNVAVHGAAISHDSMILLLHSRIEDNGDATSLSILRGSTGIGLASVLIANNELPATGSVLFHYENPATNRPELRNVTLVNNRVQGEVFHSTVNLPVAYNTIVWGNQFASLGPVTPSHSIVQGMAGISVDPQFLNASQRNYRLAITSPAIDAGNNAYGFPDAFDLDGDGITNENMPDLDLLSRPIDIPTVADTGSGTAPIIDMGVFEHQIDPCYDIAFPYTLTGANNTARVAELRQAIDCANANATADVIELGGFTLLIADADANDADNALPLISSAITLHNGTLERDTTAPNFRLLATASNAHLIADSVNFRNGRAFEGGAIYNQGVLELRNAGFFDNGDLAQTQRGGAILNLGLTFRVLGSRFERNRAELGGAIFQDTGDFFLRTSHLENNQATQGGALYVLTGLARLLGNDFVENRANAGGAIHVETFVLASGQRFLRNQATTHGGAVSGIDFLGQMKLSNSLFVGNLAPQGAVLYADNVQMSNVTLSGHTGGAGSSLFSTPTPGTNAEVSNSIIWSNANTPVGVVTINRSVVEGGFPGGTDILDVDPRFTDAAGGDYRLMAHSPAIDAGSNADVVTDTWTDIDEDGDFSEELDDLDGNPRRYDDAIVIDTGTGTAPIVDMGAFERQTNSPPIVLPTLSINDFTASEGNAGTTNFIFTVSLSAPAPAGGVSFDIATANGTATAPSDYTAHTLTGQTIPAGSSTYDFTVQVNGDTMAEPNETFLVNVTNVTGATITDGQAVGTINNDDAAGIIVNPTSGLTTTEAGGTATFTVVLNSQPSADVTIGLSSSDTTEGTVAPAALTFTSANWNTAQTVTVTGVDDAIVDGDVVYNIITAAATSTDASYNGMNAADVSVTNTDNDSAGITINPTAGLITTEAGGTATFTVVLRSQPSANVTIPIASDDTTEGTVSPGSLVFTPGNWDVAQTVTVSGVNDGIADGDQPYTVQVGPSESTDVRYDGLAGAVVTATNLALGVEAKPPMMIPANQPMALLALLLAMLAMAAVTLRGRSR